MKEDHTIIKGDQLILLEKLYYKHYATVSQQDLSVQGLIDSGLAIPAHGTLTGYTALILTPHGKNLLDHVFQSSLIHSNFIRKSQNLKLVIINVILWIIWLLIHAWTLPPKISLIFPPQARINHYNLLKAGKYFKQIQDSTPYLLRDPKINAVVQIVISFLAIVLVGVGICSLIKFMSNQIKINNYNTKISKVLTLDKLKDLINADEQLNWNDDLRCLYHVKVDDQYNSNLNQIVDLRYYIALY